MNHNRRMIWPGVVSAIMTLLPGCSEQILVGDANETENFSHVDVAAGEETQEEDGFESGYDEAEAETACGSIGIKSMQRIEHDRDNLTVPSLRWTGSEYGAVWHDDTLEDGSSDIYLARISAAGDLIAKSFMSPGDWPGFGGGGPVLEWTGSEFAAAWMETAGGGLHELHFARSSPDGDPVDHGILTQLELNENLSYFMDLGLEWTGAEYGLAWCYYDQLDSLYIYLTRVSPQGQKLDESLVATVSDPYPDYYIAMSFQWTGSEFGLAWWDLTEDDWHHVYFCRVSQTGERIGNEIRVGDGFYPSLSWTGSEYGIVWKGGSSGSISDAIYFRKISSSGELIGDEVEVMNGQESFFIFYPEIEWTGSTFGLTWEKVIPYDVDIHYFTTISSDGHDTGISVIIHDDSSHFASPPSIQWTGSEFGISWIDIWAEEGYTDIYFARIGCM